VTDASLQNNRFSYKNFPFPSGIRKCEEHLGLLVSALPHPTFGHSATGVDSSSVP